MAASTAEAALRVEVAEAVPRVGVHKGPRVGDGAGEGVPACPANAVVGAAFAAAKVEAAIPTEPGTETVGLTLGVAVTAGGAGADSALDGLRVGATAWEGASSRSIDGRANPEAGHLPTRDSPSRASDTSAIAPSILLRSEAVALCVPCGGETVAGFSKRGQLR